MAGARKSHLLTELHRSGNPPLREFLDETGLDLAELYRGGRTLTTLRREANLLPRRPPADEPEFARGMERIIGMDDPDWFAYCRDTMSGPRMPDVRGMTVRDARRWRMLLTTISQNVGEAPDLTASLTRLWMLEDLRLELAELLDLLCDRAQEYSFDAGIADWKDVPLRVHGTYSASAIAGAFGLAKPSSLREGVRWFSEVRTDVFFVTFGKSEREYSPTTRYDDYVISPTEVHWESQGRTRAESETGRRYQEHAQRGSHVLLAAREAKTRDGRTLPYLNLGPAEYVSHESEKPMRIVWRLLHPMPEHAYERFRAASG